MSSVSCGAGRTPLGSPSGSGDDGRPCGTRRRRRIAVAVSAPGEHRDGDPTATGKTARRGVWWVNFGSCRWRPETTTASAGLIAACSSSDSASHGDAVAVQGVEQAHPGRRHPGQVAAADRDCRPEEPQGDALRRVVRRPAPAGRRGRPPWSPERNRRSSMTARSLTPRRRPNAPQSSAEVRIVVGRIGRPAGLQPVGQGG